MNTFKKVLFFSSILSATAVGISSLKNADDGLPTVNPNVSYTAAANNKIFINDRTQQTFGTFYDDKNGTLYTCVNVVGGTGYELFGRDNNNNWDPNPLNANSLAQPLIHFFKLPGSKSIFALGADLDSTTNTWKSFKLYRADATGSKTIDFEQVANTTGGDICSNHFGKILSLDKNTKTWVTVGFTLLYRDGSVLRYLTWTNDASSDTANPVVINNSITGVDSTGVNTGVINFTVDARDDMRNTAYLQTDVGFYLGIAGATSSSSLVPLTATFNANDAIKFSFTNPDTTKNSFVNFDMETQSNTYINNLKTNPFEIDFNAFTRAQKDDATNSIYSFDYTSISKWIKSGDFVSFQLAMKTYTVTGSDNIPHGNLSSPLLWEGKEDSWGNIYIGNDSSKAVDMSGIKPVSTKAANAVDFTSSDSSAGFTFDSITEIYLQEDVNYTVYMTGLISKLNDPDFSKNFPQLTAGKLLYSTTATYDSNSGKDTYSTTDLGYIGTIFAVILPIGTAAILGYFAINVYKKRKKMKKEFNV